MRNNNRKISNLTKAVEGIAFQANILALHAAIAMAGEGERVLAFAAAAGEVRDLARRGAQAAQAYPLVERKQTL
jgi:methyl-accepting chemotaxis protein